MEKETPHDKALNLIQKGKIRLLDHPSRIFYVVQGKTDDYLVVFPNFCTCEDFILRSIRQPDKICYHILAVKMAQGKVEETSTENWDTLLFKSHETATD